MNVLMVASHASVYTTQPPRGIESHKGEQVAMVTLGKYTLSVRDNEEARSNIMGTSERNEYLQATINFHPPMLWSALL